VACWLGGTTNPAPAFRIHLDPGLTGRLAHPLFSLALGW
jgi:hypothetical protein